MALATQTINLDLRPHYNRQNTNIVYCSQYDSDLRNVVVNIADAGTAVNVSTYTIYVEGTKPDKHGFSYELTSIGGTVSNNAVTFPLQLQMTAVAGITNAELVFYSGDERIGSANFILAVEQAGLADDIDVSDTDIPAYVDGAQQAAQAAEDAKDAAVDAKDTAVAVAASIPEDYTTLSNDVDDLKSAFSTLTGDNGVKPNMIDGEYEPYTETEITDGYQANVAWYATGSGTIGSAGGQNGTDRAVIDLTNYTGKLAFGFDTTTSMYGSAILLLGLSTSSGATRVIYYSRSNVSNNLNNVFDLSHVNTESYAIVDLDALKALHPTAVGLFINEPSSIWKLASITETGKKKLAWATVDGYVPSIIVDANGNGDYTTISAAVAAASDEDTIYIRDGEYKETVIVNKYLHLVGQSKQNTILYQNIGGYDNCPLNITQGSVCNMTIKSLAPADTSGLSSYAYAIHLDKNFASLAKYQKCEIHNCDIYSEVNDAIGAGTNYASEYDLHDNFIHVAHNPVKTGACGFKCHNGQSQTTGKITLKNNTIITEDANGTSCYDILYHNGGISNTQPIDIMQIGNVLKYYHNGITNIFVPSAYNYGNSVSEMNTL